ncbi:PREDICTED: uncharacterized protein LOC106913532, partial [Poecilia mexicana]|uniref:uncharacterized protein LOC106913532 n=1 Tax=Poecilia mexicana TaxID=48701 RepID=UPI00072DBCCE
HVLRAAAVCPTHLVLCCLSVQQVEVKSGVESVLLPWRRGDQLVSRRSTASLPADVRVVWRDDRGRKVHVHQNGSDQPGEQDQFYRTRTRMDENLVENKNLSLTLRWPTDRDKNIYVCKVYNRDRVLMEKKVQLEVSDQQVEVEEGEESVKLEFKVTFDLQGGDRVEWQDSRGRKVHVYQIGSDQPVEQAQFYRTRTRMNEDALETKDLSLTLDRPTEKDISQFRCGVYRKGDLLGIKSTQLNLKAKKSLVQPKDIRMPLLADQSV